MYIKIFIFIFFVVCTLILEFKSYNFIHLNLELVFMLRFRAGFEMPQWPHIFICLECEKFIRSTPAGDSYQWPSFF